ncbi:MAG: response regulator transcription factor [Gammaproteobacteria bacterium]|nr:response regulator transcription factor [Gammaproteobacteria bacterium]
MKTALLVEDHEITRVWLRDLLGDAFPRINVREAINCKQAREAIKTHSFDLALLDINLPDGSGVSLVGEITKQSPETYCVMNTIMDDDKCLFSSLQAGAKGYLLKEQPREKLIKHLHGALNNEPPLSPAIARRVLRFFHKKPVTQPTSNLSSREEEVLTFIAKGLNRTDISRLLGITSNTAAGHVKNIYVKLNVSSRAEATLQAARLGLVRA